MSHASGGGVTPLCNACRYVPPQRVWFLRRFGLKTGIDVAHFCLESGMIIEGTTGLCERICRFNSKQVRKKKKICEFKTDFKKSFLFLFLSKKFLRGQV